MDNRRTRNDNAMNECSFCNRSYEHVDVMFAGKFKGVQICDKCITNVYKAYINRAHSLMSTNTSDFIPSKIYAKLNENIIGQEEAKRILSVAIYNHKKRLNDFTGKINKSNILMAGPSGSGKTLLAKTLADIIDVPFAMADATSFTEAGYAGDNVESILVNLIIAANGNLEKAQKGIVYIDEIDKIAGSETGLKSSNRNPTSDGVQFALLKLIEGSKVAIASPDSNPMMQKKILFDTSKVLFICGGAFEGMFDRHETKSMGFNSALSVLEDEKDLDVDNLKEYGMKTEFIGRFPIHVRLNELTRDEMKRVLTEPKNSIVNEYKELFRQDDIELDITDDALNKIADIAIESKVGARGLRSILEDVMLDIMFDAPNHDDYKKIIISEDTIINKVPQIIKAEDTGDDISLLDACYEAML